MRTGWLLSALAERPARLTALSFGLVALLGASLLSLPVSLRAPPVSFVDNLFTAVSAVCVTGLVVHPTASTYSAFGQVVILALMQAGALGIMVFFATFSILAGRRLQVRSTAALTQAVDASSVARLKHTVASIVLYTLSFELVGALVLYRAFTSYPGTALGAEFAEPLAGAGDQLWAAVFHAVSAFCNAGFTIFHAGVQPFAADWAVNSTLMLLIIAGGIGFPVLDELGQRCRRVWQRRRPNRLSLHARVVLWVSGLLIGVAMVLILALESDATLAERAWHERVLLSAFQSVSARTAGFNTLTISELTAPSLMFLCLFMFVGASPGSTGGGVKTTTLAVLFANYRAELTGADHPVMLDRSLGASTVRRAAGVFFLSVLVVSMVLLLLLVLEEQEPLSLAFEAFSAFGTVGLSVGVTSELSAPGKMLVALTMLLGRIGPLTLALALSVPRPAHGSRYPEEDVVIG